ncbi:hypothetical protein PUN28_002990 [Cardiocondyla obscurior]|uniref:Uncharacterized protein n=1 Tax=Cardiocondyla obscurior TaxID=286306 RepID=A0AAW2GXE4_9HYME
MIYVCISNTLQFFKSYESRCFCGTIICGEKCSQFIVICCNFVPMFMSFDLYNKHRLNGAHQVHVLQYLVQLRSFLCKVYICGAKLLNRISPFSVNDSSNVDINVQIVICKINSQ